MTFKCCLLRIDSENKHHPRFVSTTLKLHLLGVIVEADKYYPFVLCNQVSCKTAHCHMHRLPYV